MTGTFLALAAASPWAISGASTAIVMTASTPWVRSSGRMVETTAGLPARFLIMTSPRSFCAATWILLAQRASDSEPVLMTMTPILRGFRASFALAPKELIAKQRLKPTVPATNLENFIVFLPLHVVPLKAIQAD